ncbi:hypothetical protein FOZ63_000864 [Perkinsus olseni]|uniref:Uncharacterized protein n=1 Tax=Perkinsus olseni TaxID=32597 RepID=A0A7J6U2Z9_PEROL|nr:hypothetical protein FOZ63_000864 [Perkinsus olseni]
MSSSTPQGTAAPTSSSKRHTVSFWSMLCRGVLPSEILDLFSGRRCFEEVVVDAYITIRDFLSSDTSLTEVMAKWAISVISISIYWCYSIFYWLSYWLKFWVSLLVMLIPQFSQLLDLIQAVIETFILEWIISGGPAEDTESYRPGVLLVTMDPGNSPLARALRETSLRKRVHLRGISTASSPRLPQCCDDIDLIMVDCMYNTSAHEEPVKLPPTAAKAARCKFVMSNIQEVITTGCRDLCMLTDACFFSLRLTSSFPPAMLLPRILFVCDDESALYVSAGLTLVRATLGPRTELECCTYGSLKQKLPLPYSYKRAVRRVRLERRASGSRTPRGELDSEGTWTTESCSGRDTPTSMAASLATDTALTLTGDRLDDHMQEELPSLQIRSRDDGSLETGRKDTASLSSPSTSSSSPNRDDLTQL